MCFEGSTLFPPANAKAFLGHGIMPFPSGTSFSSTLSVSFQCACSVILHDIITQSVKDLNFTTVSQQLKIQ